MTLPDTRILVQSLASTLCPACGGFKGERKTLCPRCYGRLTGATKQALYRRVGDGYEQALSRAFQELRVDEFQSPAPASTPKGRDPGQAAGTPAARSGHTTKPVAPAVGGRRVEDVVMPFGKHQGKRLGDILGEDAAYLDWLQTCDITSQRLAEAVAEINLKYQDRIEQACGERSWRTDAER